MLNGIKNNCKLTYTYTGSNEWIISLIVYGDGADISAINEVEQSISTDLKPVILFGNVLPSEEDNKENESQSQSVQHVEDKTKIFDVVEQMPAFPGGNAALMKYLSQNIRYPIEAEKNGIQGRVLCTFVVERDGAITNVKVVKSVDPSLDKEAVRVISISPKWIPGKQNGKAVRVNYMLPITFRITEEEEVPKETPIFSPPRIKNSLDD